MRPDTSQVPLAEEIYARIAPLAADDQRYGWALLTLCIALGLMRQPAATLVRDTADGDPGWSIILDIDRCPTYALPWLAQCVGARIPAGTDDSTARQMIRAEQSFARGRPATIVATIQRTLTGTRTVFLTERADGDAYKLRIRTFDTETTSPTATQALIVAAQKPGGIVLDYGTVAAGTYGHLATAEASYTQVAVDYLTYNRVRAGAHGT